MTEDNNLKKDTDKTNLKKLKMMNTEEEKKRPEELNKDLKVKAESLSTNTRRNTWTEETMKEKTEEIELQERTDTQAMKNIEDLYILSGIPLFYKF